jgi:hypothetical protein
LIRNLSASLFNFFMVQSGAGGSMKAATIVILVLAALGQQAG